MKDLVILGVGGMAREIHETVEDLVADGEGWNFLGFLDDAPAAQGTEVHGHPVLGPTAWLEAHPGVHAVVGIGSTPIRHRLVQALSGAGHARWATLVHPSAYLGRRVTLGEGTVVCPGCSLTTDLVVGDHVLLNLATTLTHDDRIGSFVTISPGVNVSGNVTIEAGCDIGTGATILQGLTIGAWTIVGGGAVVIRDLAANVTAVGVPAAEIKRRDDGWHLRP